MLTGPDVSHWQGAVDWPEVAQAGHAFGWAKATEGRSFVDSRFRANWAGVAAAGLVRGAYHFLRAENDPAAQARHFLDVVGDLSGSLAALDVETSGAGTNPTVDQAGAFVAEFARLTSRHPLVIYTGRWYWHDILGDPYGAALGQLWHSRYRTDPGAMYGGWPAWTFWQHTNTAQVPGIAGGCDLNRFDGGHNDLLALAGQPLEDDMPTVEEIRAIVRTELDRDMQADGLDPGGIAQVSTASLAAIRRTYNLDNVNTAKVLAALDAVDDEIVDKITEPLTDAVVAAVLAHLPAGTIGEDTLRGIVRGEVRGAFTDAGTPDPD